MPPWHWMIFIIAQTMFATFVGVCSVTGYGLTGRWKDGKLVDTVAHRMQKSALDLMSTLLADD